MGIVISILFCLVFLAAGYGISRLVFSRERPFIRVWMGGVFSLLLLLWLPALWSFIFGFTIAAQWAAFFTCLALGFGALFFLKKRGLPVTSSPWREEWPALMLLPLFLLGTYLFFTHIIPMKNGALYAGQSTFGDLPLHLGLVTSLGEQGLFPPEYSILPGVQVGYPFLCDSISATFYVLGAPLRFSMLLPAIFAYALVLLGVFYFFERWLKGRGVTILATLLFFMGGGFGFAYFFDLLKSNPENLLRLFYGFYNTPNNFIEKGMIWVNPIADMLIPQRATLFGWALLFPSLYLLRRAAFEEEHRLFLPLGIIAGAMPLVHTHSFFALGVLSACYLFQAIVKRDTKKSVLTGWFLYGATALLLAAPQLIFFTFRQSGDFLKFHFNWSNSLDSFLWFYVKNLGLLFLLLPVAFFRLDKRERGFYLGAAVLWALSEFIQFQPNPYDNNKLLFIWFALTCGIVAKLLVELYGHLKGFRGARFIAGMTLVSLFLSGVLTLGREVVSEYTLFDKDAVDAAEFIKENTAPDAMFLTNSNHNNLVSSLTGRNIVCGTGSYLYYHGLDYSDREYALADMYGEPNIYFQEYADLFNVNYVLIGDYERYAFYCDEAYFDQRFPVAYENESITIYRVPD